MPHVINLEVLYLEYLTESFRKLRKLTTMHDPFELVVFTLPIILSLLWCLLVHAILYLGIAFIGIGTSHYLLQVNFAWFVFGICREDVIRGISKTTPTEDLRALWPIWVTDIRAKITVSSIHLLLSHRWLISLGHNLFLFFLKLMRWLLSYGVLGTCLGNVCHL